MNNEVMKKNIVIVCLMLLSCCSYAQNERTETLVQSEEKGWEYELKAGVNIGGASPTPLPVISLKRTLKQLLLICILSI